MDETFTMVEAAQNASRGNQVNLAVLRKAMDVEEQQGAAVVAMIKAAGQVGTGGRTPDGGVDVYA